ncbi:MAG: EI24 domain-containing protein [Xenococcaceae cyanobacterium MO_188.B32]|nr:EI24 domain-containing protein [Xenococcaceae cyanobacterium MO_188.B32]
MLRILSGFGLITGATYPFRALATFGRNPRLWQYIAIPILVNSVVAIALYSGLLLFGFNLVEDLTLDISRWLDNVIANLPAWLSFLEYTTVGLSFILRLLLIVVLLIATGFLLTQFGVLLGAPWYGQLSEQLEKVCTGKVEIIEVSIFRDIGRAILFELKKLVLITTVGIPLFLLNFVVGIGTLGSTIGSLALATTITCLDFLDAPLERRRLPFRQKLKIVFRSLPASASFGIVCLGLISIPLLNLFTIPLCVASGTLFFCDRILPKYSGKR